MTPSDREDGLSGWDRLSPIEVEAADPVPTDHWSGPKIGWITRLAVAWADLVAIAAATTALIGAVVLAGYPFELTALPWAVVVALLAWVVISGVLIRVRKAGLGMLLAGVVFTDEVTGFRLVAAVVVSALCALLVGVPALPSAGGVTLVSAVAGSGLAATVADA